MRSFHDNRIGGRGVARTPNRGSIGATTGVTGKTARQLPHTSSPATWGWRVLSGVKVSGALVGSIKYTKGKKARKGLREVAHLERFGRPFE